MNVHVTVEQVTIYCDEKPSQTGLNLSMFSEYTKGKIKIERAVLIGNNGRSRSVRFYKTSVYVSVSKNKPQFAVMIMWSWWYPLTNTIKCTVSEEFPSFTARL